jgi:hypothetical protein
MASKTFKIGEYAVGGIIRVNTNGETVEIRAMDWNTNDILSKYEINLKREGARQDIVNVLEELTTHYYADNIIKWLQTRINLKPGGFFPSW